MIKLIALDLDGTLLNDNQNIDNKTISILKKIKDRGIKIVLCSSRPFYRMKKFLKYLNLDCEGQYTISFNGGLILENGNEKILFITNFKPTEVSEIIEVGINANMKVLLYERTNIIANKEDEVYRMKNPDSSFEVRDFSNLDFNNLIIYKILFLNEEEEIVKMRKKMPLHIENKYKVTSSHPRNIEIVPKINTKALGLEKICKILGVVPNEIAVFGDNENDIDMFEYAGYSVAMGNAIDSIKDMADFVTLSNDEDGVAYAIEKMIENGLIK